MSHDDLAERILTATGLPFDAYAADVTVRFQAKRDTEIVMRNGGVLIKFRLYRL